MKIMDAGQIIARLKGFEPELRLAGLERLYLFGSRARGDHRIDSDIDLAFESDPNVFDLWAQAGVIASLTERLGLPVDLVDRRRLRPRIRPFVEPDLVQVF